MTLQVSAYTALGARRSKALMSGTDLVLTGTWSAVCFHLILPCSHCLLF